jgi:hypothetical protein
MKLSQKRLEAKRANATRSVGPVTPEAKARAAANATRHGLLAKQVLIGNESAGNFKALCDILLQRFAPVDDFEYGLIEELASAYWRLRRAWALETEMLENAMQKQTARRQLARMDATFAELAVQPQLDLLHRYESRLHLRVPAGPPQPAPHPPNRPANQKIRKRTQNSLSLQRIHRRNPLENRSKRLQNRPKSAESAPSPPSGITP